MTHLCGRLKRALADANIEMLSIFKVVETSAILPRVQRVFRSRKGPEAPWQLLLLLGMLKTTPRSMCRGREIHMHSLPGQSIVVATSLFHFFPYSIPHLSKGRSGLKQKCTQTPTPFLSTVFHALSHGEIHFLPSVSSKNL